MMDCTPPMQPPRFHIGANDVAILYPTCPQPPAEPVELPTTCVPLGAPPMVNRPTCPPPTSTTTSTAVIAVRAIVVIREHRVAEVLLVHGLR
jgi:hypothetical protein